MIQSVIQGCKAGTLSGIIWGLLILAFISPVIEKAEIYEERTQALFLQNKSDQEALNMISVLADPHMEPHRQHQNEHSHQHSDFQPKRWQKPLLTLLGSTLLGIAYGILVSIAVALKFVIEPGLTRQLRVKESLELTFKWGIGLGLVGFLIFQGIPALGIQPALPGVIGAEKDYGIRQSWWLLSVLCNLAGALIGLFSLSFLQKRDKLKKIVLVGISVGVVAFPFLTPGVPDYSKNFVVPIVFQQQFLIVSLTVSLLFWFMLGTSFIYLMRKKILLGYE